MLDCQISDYLTSKDNPKHAQNLTLIKRVLIRLLFIYLSYESIYFTCVVSFRQCGGSGQVT